MWFWQNPAIPPCHRQYTLCICESRIWNKFTVLTEKGKSVFKYCVRLNQRCSLRCSFQMLCSARAVFTWRTSWSTPERTRCTWSRRSCRAARSQAPGDRPGWDHTVRSILTAAPVNKGHRNIPWTRRLLIFRLINHKLFLWNLSNRPWPPPSGDE